MTRRPSGSSAVCARAIVFTIATVLRSLLTDISLAPAEQWTPSQIHQRYQSSLVFIRVTVTAKNGDQDSWTGTGFIVDKSGYVLTNGHVVPFIDDYQKVEITGSVQSRHQQVLRLSLIKREPQVGLALLLLPDVGTTWSPVEFGDSNSVPPSAQFLVLGFPLDLDLSSAAGIFSNKNVSGGLWQTDVTLNPGNSGGPVFTSDEGKVVAIVAGGHSRAQPISRVIPANYASNLLSMAGVASPANRAGPSSAPTLPRTTLPLPPLTFISNRPDTIKALLAYLQGQGATASSITTHELPKLVSLRPELLIVASDTAGAWKSMSKAILRQFFESYRVVGLGEGGIELFSILGLRLAQAMYLSAREVSVEIPELLQRPLTVNARGTVVDVLVTQGYVRGTYDSGAPALAGFEGIGRWLTFPNHWPIARQGQYLLWGFTTPTDDVTDAGKRLFANLLADHGTRPIQQLAKLTAIHYIAPGSIGERLTAQFPDHEWNVQIRRPGRITARLSWQPADRHLALIVNGPGQVNALARKDGRSPLAVEIDVKDSDIIKGTDWRISVHAFEEFGVDVVDYRLDLLFPE